MRNTWKWYMVIATVLVTTVALICHWAGVDRPPQDRDRYANQIVSATLSASFGRPELHSVGEGLFCTVRNSTGGPLLIPNEIDLSFLTPISESGLHPDGIQLCEPTVVARIRDDNVMILAPGETKVWRIDGAELAAAWNSETRLLQTGIVAWKLEENEDYALVFRWELNASDFVLCEGGRQRVGERYPDASTNVRIVSNPGLRFHGL